MIEAISFSKTATYGELPELLEPLKRINFIFGTNGTGKTTISRVIANCADYASCEVTWKGDQPMQTLVYNRDFVERNFIQSAELKGVFTLGEKQLELQEELNRQKQEVDSYKSRRAGVQAVLDGTDSTPGKRAELENLEHSFQERCWEAYGKHKGRLSLAFEGFRNSKKVFKDKVLCEAESNVSQSVPLDELQKRSETIFGQNSIEVNPVPNVNFTQLLGYETDPIIKKRVIGKEDVDIAEMIQRLGNSDWVREGRSFYEINDRVCPFCQRGTHETFERSLNEYFNESFEKDNAAIALLLSNYKKEVDHALQELANVVAAPSQ